MQAICFALIFGAALLCTLAAADEASDVPDSFEIFDKFPFAIAISDSNNDTIYECLTAKRAWFDRDAKKGEYIWLLRGHHGKPKKTLSFYVADGSSPDTFIYMEGSEDAKPEVGTFYYTDMETCAVLDMPFSGRQCILWAAEDKQDSLPQKCLDEFSEHCGVGIPLYSKDLCKEDEISHW
uniref:Putative lipocalin-5 1 n=1 Tax=Amblyomma triste TaxID=251400 RepID=A0A023G938_AMBTT